ncbi:MAG: hypothetical protein M4579_002732 [Chaenotheca gracillima]|nr:MAG: hypothetical protein M4579_002732 [Chaenotheca gracillima]
MQGSSENPRPKYFVCRENGDLVPLIAADELPPEVTVGGVPRSFGGLEDTLNMISLGKADRAVGNYFVTIGTPSPHQTSISVATAMSAEPQGDQAENEALKPAPWRPSQNRLWNKDNAGLRFGGIPRDVKKEFCTYWIYRGDCAYIHSPQGCRYKHEMPVDLETMQRVGLRSFPRWWKEKFGSTLSGVDSQPTDAQDPITPPASISTTSHALPGHIPVQQSPRSSMSTGQASTLQPAKLGTPFHSPKSSQPSSGSPDGNIRAQAARDRYSADVIADDKIRTILPRPKLTPPPPQNSDEDSLAKYKSLAPSPPFPKHSAEELSSANETPRKIYSAEPPSYRPNYYFKDEPVAPRPDQAPTHSKPKWAPSKSGTGKRNRAAGTKNSPTPPTEVLVNLDS